MSEFTIGNITLVEGDCLDLMHHLIGKPKVCVTDPPYRLTSGGGKRNDFGGNMSKARYDNDGNLGGDPVDLGEFASALYSCLDDQAHAYIMSSDRVLIDVLNAVRDAGFHHHNILTWDKCSPIANRWYMKRTEFVTFCSKGRAYKVKDNGVANVIRARHRKITKHPAEKPVWMMAHFIAQSSDIGDFVIDPFLGSGTTAIAAMDTGRSFIGFEKDPEFFDMACQRLEVADRARTLFPTIDEPSQLPLEIDL